MALPPPTRILGIDPGSRFTGYGIIESQANRLRYITAGRVVAGKGPLVDRLEVIFRDITELIEQHAPTVAAVEGLFHHRNADSALKLGHARGVAVVACRLQGLALHEYQPSVVKQAVVGHGHADKQQVQIMVKNLLRLRGDLELDASDALAVAACHAFRAPAEARLAELRSRR